MTSAKLQALAVGTRVYFHRPRHKDDGDEGTIMEAHTLATGLIEGPHFIQWDDGQQTEGRDSPLRYVRKL